MMADNVVFLRCGPCHTTFQAWSSEAAEAMLQEHQRQSHPEAFTMAQLVTRLDRLVKLLEEKR